MIHQIHCRYVKLRIITIRLFEVYDVTLAYALTFSLAFSHKSDRYDYEKLVSDQIYLLRVSHSDFFYIKIYTRIMTVAFVVTNVSITFH